MQPVPAIQRCREEFSPRLPDELLRHCGECVSECVCVCVCVCVTPHKCFSAHQLLQDSLMMSFSELVEIASVSPHTSVSQCMFMASLMNFSELVASVYLNSYKYVSAH